MSETRIVVEYRGSRLEIRCGPIGAKLGDADCSGSVLRLLRIFFEKVDATADEADERSRDG